ncbi:hypothetical protein SUGI_0887940 [Cryptomeria japonica]|uniref:protein DMP6-like n=1 Tax=Cryptomeria japonica TaxID=3369 RepID=UPI002414B9C2|nr:protein DMP6-like [Cryptomeria japonica]GLJ42832.1 hypothetical protein SUGI_0887940 [Cryptomeria japonica]
MKHSSCNVKSDEESLLPISSKKTTTTASSVVNSTLSSASNIAKILPTGILFVFQALSNLLSNSQECQTSDKYLVGVVVAILGIACFFFSLVDTFTDASTGKVYYGIATVKGLATGNEIKPSIESDYKIKSKDLVHAAMAVLVFCVIALTDQNVVHCLYPSEEANIQKIYQALLVALGALSGVVVVKLPSKRQGITSPVTKT